MGLKLAIFYESSLLSLASDVCSRIEHIFPRIQAALFNSLEIPRTAWDTFRGQYDIYFLLNSLERPQQADFVLWLVQGDIGDPWHAYLYGAAGNQKAIVSTARFDAIDMVAKEAYHEVGHLLGLSHCDGDCVMHTSRTVGQVVRKSNQLCEACQALLEVSKYTLIGNE